MRTHSRLTILLSATLLFSACDPSNGPTDTFDRGAMLQHFADHMIRPAYDELHTQTLGLHVAVASFNGDPTSENLDILRAAWQDAYYRWQNANAFNFGPAGEQGLQKSLVEEVGTFPVSVSKIEGNIVAGIWSMTDSNRDARGFLAIEYLIFGSAPTAQEIVAAFSASDNRKGYLHSLSQNLKDRTEAVSAAWNGSYYTEFINNKGTDVGSSTSLFYNEFVRSFEAAKNFKLGLPMGKRPGQTQSESQLVEAYYSGESVKCLGLHLNTLEFIWKGYGIDNLPSGKGFKQYLEAVEGGTALISNTEIQLNALRSVLATVPNDPALSTQINDNNPKLETLYTEIQKLTRYYKSDLSSLLGIAITFSSGDGD